MGPESERAAPFGGLPLGGFKQLTCRWALGTSYHMPSCHKLQTPGKSHLFAAVVGCRLQWSGASLEISQQQMLHVLDCFNPSMV